MSTQATTELKVNGMTCNNCARKVTDAAQKVAGVHSVSVSLETKRASVRWNSTEARNVPSLIAAIARAGYDAKEISLETSGGEAKQSRWQWNLVLGLAVTAALGCLPPACAAVEDSSNGLRSAAAAGLRVIAVPQPRYPPNPVALAAVLHEQAERLLRLRNISPLVLDLADSCIGSTFQSP